MGSSPKKKPFAASGREGSPSFGKHVQCQQGGSQRPQTVWPLSPRWNIDTKGFDLDDRAPMLRNLLLRPCFCGIWTILEVTPASDSKWHLIHRVFNRQNLVRSTTEALACLKAWVRRSGIAFTSKKQKTKKAPRDVFYQRQSNLFGDLKGCFIKLEITYLSCSCAISISQLAGSSKLYRGMLYREANGNEMSLTIEIDGMQPIGKGVLSLKWRQVDTILDRCFLRCSFC